MGFMSLCSDDPVEVLLRRTFKADILRVPEARVQPLCTVCRRGTSARFWGDLIALLQGSSPLGVKAGTATRVADISGKQTSAVSLDLGIDLLSGFLQGFGVTVAGLALKAALGSTRKLAFSFEEVERVSVDPALLGRVLGDRKLKTDGSATKLFLAEGPWGTPFELLAVNSVLRSGRFKIHLQETREQGGKLALPEIQGILAKAEIAVEQTAEHEVAFRRTGREVAPTFAFTALRIYLEADGAMALAPISLRGGLEGLRSLESKDEPQPQRIHDEERPGLLTFDDVPTDAAP